MKKSLRLVLLFSIFALVGSLAFAGLEEDSYKKMFAADTEKTELEALFADSFLKLLPIGEIEKIIAIYTDSLGELVGLEEDKSPMVLRFTKGIAPTTIAFDAENKISSLWFGAPELRDDSISKVVGDFKELEGKVGLCLLKNGKEELVAFNADEPLAVGSAFKLYVLAALEQQVKEKKLKYSDVIQLKKNWQSMPSGITQEWYPGASLTLETLAVLMISLSDNTATDHLFNFLGRDMLNEVFPETSTPVLNTMDMFKLKIFYPEKGEAFVKANKSQRSKMLKQLAEMEVDQNDFAEIIRNWKKPKMLEIAWHITNRQLCETIFSLKGSKALRVNPAQGIANKKDWQVIGFKGGIEPGVLNFTWILQPKNSKDFYSFSCTINNAEKEVDTTAFSMLASRMLKLIAAK
jgi:beta-lactamase class A